MSDLDRPTGKDEDFNAYYDARPTEPAMERSIGVDVVGQRCVYVNDYRIAGGKPYHGENLPNHSFSVAAREALQAFSDDDLKAALRERESRKAYMARWHSARAAILKAKGDA